MKPPYILTCSLMVSTCVTAYDASHCNALLERGISDITTRYGAQYAIAHKWHQYCRNKEYLTSEQKTQEAHASFFSLGGGGGTNEVSRMRQELDSWCEQNREFAASRSDFHEEARVINASALESWNQCQALAKKDIKISFAPQGIHSEHVHFEIDSDSDADYYFYDVKQDGFDCKISGAEDNKSRNELDVLTVMRPIKNANFHVDCARNKPVIEDQNGTWRSTYPIGYIAISTTGPYFAVSFPEVPEVYFSTPPGAVLAFAAESCPVGWEPYDKAVNVFIRGWDVKGSRALESPQDDDFKSHSHGVDDPGHVHSVANISDAGNNYDHGKDHSAWGHYSAPMLNTKNATTGVKVQNAGGEETRPKNIALLYCIKK